MTQKLNIALILLIAIALNGAAAAEAASATRSVVSMQAHPTDPREPGKRDRSALTRNDTGIVVEIFTSNLDQAAYTVWWVIFNNPEFCASLPCTADDLPANGGDARIEASAMYADGRLVGSNGRGRFVAGLAVEEIKDALYGPGLLDPSGAEVHLLVRTHGVSIPEVLHSQITTPAGGCPPNSCGDQQFAIHLP